MNPLAADVSPLILRVNGADLRPLPGYLSTGRRKHADWSPICHDDNSGLKRRGLDSGATCHLRAIEFAQQWKNAFQIVLSRHQQLECLGVHRNAVRAENSHNGVSGSLSNGPLTHDGPRARGSALGT